MMRNIKQNQLPNRQLVGYARSYGCFHSCEVQADLIQSHCDRNGLCCSQVYTDFTSHDRRRGECQYAKELGLPTTRWFTVHPEFEKLLLDIKKGMIGTILVDTELRLEGSAIENEVLRKLCVEHEVNIIPVMQRGAEKLQMAVYHFTAGSQIRPGISCSVLDNLYTYALMRNYDVSDLYFDRSLKKGERVEWSELLERIGNYQSLLVSSFYHMEMKAITFAKFACKYVEKIRLLSMEEGEIKVLDKTWMNRKLRVAFYNKCKMPYEYEKSSLTLNRLLAFIDAKAPEWSLSGCYIDESSGECMKMQQLINDISEYDLVVIETFSKLGERTNALMKLWKQIGGIPIFSIKEGGLMLCEK